MAVTPGELLDYTRRRLPQFVQLLQQLVEFETPTEDKGALDRFASFLAGEYRRAGAVVEVLERANCGNHLRVAYGDGPAQILVLAHMDTVWPLGTIAERPFRVEGNRAYGPGVNDDKGGVLIALAAIQTMAELDIHPRHQIVILHNSDEEGGSRDSRVFIAEEARRSRYALVLEVSTDDGAVKTARRGGGTFRLKARGVAAHAGNDMHKGVHSVEELAHHVLWLQSLNDAKAGVTVNVGTVRGGRKASLVPEEAELTAYYRVWDPDHLSRLQHRVNGREAMLDGATLSVEWGPIRPPFVRTPEVAALFAHAQTLAHEMGLELGEAAAGAGSDGNLAAATGTPTLDGLGPVGQGAHSANECVDLERLPERIALLIRLLSTLS